MINKLIRHILKLLGVSDVNVLLTLHNTGIVTIRNVFGIQNKACNTGSFSISVSTDRLWQDRWSKQIY